MYHANNESHEGVGTSVNVGAFLKKLSWFYWEKTHTTLKIKTNHTFLLSHSETKITFRSNITEKKKFKTLCCSICIVGTHL